jgi:nucleoside-diphosphate-sugar epimerase
MRVLVMGAGGYVGVPLVAALAERGHEVLAVDRYFFGKDKLGDLASDPRVTVVVDDVRRMDSSLLDGVEGVIDLAGLSNDLSAEIDPNLTREINFEGGARLARLAHEAGVRRYVYSSSASVYGHGNKLRLSEEDECHPQTLYAESKLHVERELTRLSGPKFEVVILRNATVFGLAPRMRYDLAVNIMTLRAWKDRVIYVMGGGEQWRPFVHVNDVVQALVLGLETDAATVAGETFNVGDDTLNFQIRQLAELVRSQIPDVVVHNIPDDPDKRTYNLAFEKIRSKLGFAPTRSVLDGIVEIRQALDRGASSGDDKTCYTLQWYKSLLEWHARLSDILLDGRLL